MIASGRPPDTAERRATDLVRPTRGTPRVLASLTNRFFFTSAALVLAAIAVTMSSPSSRGSTCGKVRAMSETCGNTIIEESATMIHGQGRSA